MTNPYEASGNTALMPGIDPEFLSQVANQIHEVMTMPAVIPIAQRIQARQAPRGGYWEPYAKALGAEDTIAVDAIVRDHEAASRAKDPEERDGFDLFLLGTGGDAPADLHTPADSYLTPYGYYIGTGQRVAEALQDGRLPEGFEDPAILENTVALLLARGLVGLTRQPDRRDSDLDAALTIMLEATQRVKGFDPARAGLNRLYDRAISYAGILRADSGYPDNNTGRNIARRALYVAEQTIATLYIQGRDNLLDE